MENIKPISIIRIENLIHQIQKTDKMILLHTNRLDAFMGSQYLEMKQRFFEKLVKEILKLQLPFEQTSYYLQRFSQQFTDENTDVSIKKLPELEKLIANN